MRHFLSFSFLLITISSMDHGPFDASFRAPVTAIVSGPTVSGKSQFIKDLIKYKDQLFNPKINKVLYCFGEYSPAFEGMKDVEFHRGFTEELIDRSKLGVNNEQTLLILDE